MCYPGVHLFMLLEFILLLLFDFFLCTWELLLLGMWVLFYELSYNSNDFCVYAYSLFCVRFVMRLRLLLSCNVGALING